MSTDIRPLSLVNIVTHKNGVDFFFDSLNPNHNQHSLQCHRCSRPLQCSYLPYTIAVSISISSLVGAVARALPRCFIASLIEY